MNSWITQLSIYADGNCWCAISKGFTNIQESPCGFGDTPLEAAKKWFFDGPIYQWLGYNWWDWRQLIPIGDLYWHKDAPYTTNQRSPDIFIIPSSLGEPDVFVYCLEATRPF